MPITEPFWDDPNTDGPYDWENFEDYLDESHNSYMSENMNMKHGYSVINEIKLALPAMAQVMGCQEIGRAHV